MERKVNYSSHLQNREKALCGALAKLESDLSLLTEKNRSLTHRNRMLEAKLKVLTHEKEMHITGHADQQLAWGTEKRKFLEQLTGVKASYKDILRLVQEIQKNTAENSLKKKVNQHEKKPRLIESRISHTNTARAGMHSCFVNTLKPSGFKSIHHRGKGKLEKLLQDLDVRQTTLKEQIKQLETQTDSTKETEISQRHPKRKFK